MPDDTAEPSADEQALAGAFRELERSSGRPADLEHLVREHPHLEREIRDLRAMQQALNLARGSLDPPMPERLGEFRIVRRLEAGGMGDVYEAWQEPLNRRVAIKVLRQGHHPASARERFMREQRVLAQLHQTNIVPIHTAGREGTFEYFAMPFIDGAALRHVVQAAADFESARPGTGTPSIADLIGTSRGTEAAGAPRPPAPGADAPRRRPEFRPSLDYLRSVARVMADAARAVQHAHEQSILHRDIKPSNIMVAAHATADGRRADQCWVIDFGLASFRHESGTAGAPASPAPGRPPGRMPTISGIMGTPSYMAPEQFDGRADVRTDVWGLGVTLYELLTLRRAFPPPEAGSDAERFAAVRDLIRDVDPPRPRGLIPRDLEAICFRALCKDPAQRYASAHDLAEDLRRWLRQDAVIARGQETPLLAVPLRSARWAQRNKGWATALAITLAGLAAVVLTGFLAADARRRGAERASQLQRLELIASQTHAPGWSDKARDLARAIARDGEDDSLREAFACSLAGLDAHVVARRPLTASSLAFDGDGTLLLGGAPATPNGPAEPGRAWDLSGDPQDTGPAQPGPVARRADGTRVQLVQSGSLEFSTWDMTRRAPLATYSLGHAAGLDGVVPNDLGHPVLALAADGSVAAAALAGTADGSGEVALWDAASGRGLGSLPVRATALAVAADGRYLATGERRGRVSVWALPSGERTLEVTAADDEVQSLAFGPDPGARAVADCNLQLAIGFAPGRIVVWDPVHQRVRATCRGMSDRVAALAFSPDGSLLAAGGADAMLWDAASGEHLLSLGGTYDNAVAFSDDGRRLAVAQYPAFRGAGEVVVWDLQFGRGLRTLRGFDMAVHIVAISDDGLRVAGLSTEWQVGVWDRESGSLILVVDAPRGVSADNAALVISHDGSQLACLSGTRATLWDIATGRELRTWTLPAGLVDQLTFDAHGDLIAARSVSLTPDAPTRNCVGRVRNLSRDVELLAIHDFEPHITSMALDPQGEWVAIEGEVAPTGARFIRAFEIPSGRVLFSAPASKTRDVSSLQADPTGEFFICEPRADADRLVVALPAGNHVPVSPNTRTLGPHADVVLAYYVTDSRASGTELHRRTETRPLLQLRGTNVEFTKMDLSGNFIVFGRSDGTVALADLAAIGDAFRDAGLDW